MLQPTPGVVHAPASARGGTCSSQRRGWYMLQPVPGVVHAPASAGGGSFSASAGGRTHVCTIWIYSPYQTSVRFQGFRVQGILGFYSLHQRVQQNPDARSLCVLPRGGTQVMLVYASGQCIEQRSCGCSQLWHSAPPGMAVGCCELRLRSTPRYRLVCICFPTPGRGLPYGSGLGLSRCLGPGECLHSFNNSSKGLGF